MINAAITIGFIGLVVFLGKHLFNVKDWGRYEPRRNDSGIVQGKYLPPVYLRDRPVTPAHKDFYDRHKSLLPLEYMDVIERS